MDPAIVFRAPTGRVYAVGTWIVAAVVLVALVIEGGASALVRYGALPLLLAALGWTAFWRPHVRVEGSGVRVVNVLSTTWLPWQAITGTKTRWGLEITTHGRTVGAWALPARSAVGRWTRTHREPPALSPPETIAADSPGGGDAVAAAELIEQYASGSAGGARPERRVDIVPAGVLLATAGLALVTLLL